MNLSYIYLAASNITCIFIVNLKTRVMENLRKSYVIVDENNRWLGTGYNETDIEIKETVKEIRNRLSNDGESNVDLLLFEIKGSPIHV